MNTEELISRLTAVESREKSNTKRLDKLESDHEVLARLATSIEVMATKQDAMADKLDTVNSKVDVLEHIPANHWREAVGYILAAAASAGVTLLLNAIFG